MIEREAMPSLPRDRESSPPTLGREEIPLKKDGECTWWVFASTAR
jgi:hypothetical protein